MGPTECLITGPKQAYASKNLDLNYLTFAPSSADPAHQTATRLRTFGASRHCRIGRPMPDHVAPNDSIQFVAARLRPRFAGVTFHPQEQAQRSQRKRGRDQRQFRQTQPCSECLRP